jgi:serine/threonine protein kinase
MRRSLGRYEITHELGQGGMGAVWVARDRDQGGREVALNLLAPRVTAPISPRRNAVCRGLFLIDACAPAGMHRPRRVHQDGLGRSVSPAAEHRPPLRTGHAPAKAAYRTYATDDVSRQPAARNTPTARRV